jgi:hypothetical protein
MKTVSVFLLVLGISLLTLGHPASADSGIDEGTTEAAFQQYENGYMLWRADTGGIWVFAQNGWIATYFPEDRYRDLPDNPVSEPPPVQQVPRTFQFIKPVRGFGRVWGNFAEVRAQLGWAITDEVSYTTTFQSVGYTAGGLWQVAVALPIRARVVIRQDGTWGYMSSARPVDSLPDGTSMPAAMQTFERGSMLYWPETGSIWVLYADGRTEHYASIKYGALPDNPFTAAPPAGMFRPILGFGKVWGHFPQVRQGLGWATAWEKGYTTPFNRISQPDGSTALEVQDPYGQTIVLRDD